MYYYEKDYIMRLIHGVAQMLAKLLLEYAAWDDREKASLAIAFYDYLNSRDDAFLAAADFSRDEIITGMEDALKLANMEIPEYLRLG